MSGYIAKFDRISRNHSVPDLAVSGDADRIAEQIFAYARPKCASQDVSVAVDLGTHTVTIMAGMHVAGTATLEEA
jgi:hypothetical protein